MNKEQFLRLKLTLSKEKDRLNKLVDSGRDYSDEVAIHFPLGRVGGSGKNNSFLNRKRAADLDRTIDRAKECVELREKIKRLESIIKHYEADHSQKHIAKANWFRNLKPGDTFQPGNYPVKIIKVNKKSLVTESGSKWTAEEIIGKEAAKLL